jgi:hypothetical protein
MSYPTHDTDWATSAKGNLWKRIDGTVLVVGRCITGGGFWAMADGSFASKVFSSEEAAMAAAEALAAGNRWG